MGSARICLIASTILAAVHAISVSRHSSVCGNFVSTDLGPGYNISEGVTFSPGSLNSSGIINELSLCRVQGTVSYGSNAAPDPNGPHILTWELFLPISSEYNGRFMTVGKDVPVNPSSTIAGN